MLLLAVAFMYLIMVAQFQSLKSPFIILFTIPMAFTGGFLGLLITGKRLKCDRNDRICYACRYHCK